MLTRITYGLLGYFLGSILGLLAGLLLPPESRDALPATLGGVIGAAIGLLWPVRADSRMRMPPVPVIVPGRPVPLTALGHVTAHALERPVAAVLGVGAILLLALIPATLWIFDAIGARPSLLALGIVVTIGFIALMAAIAFIPPFLVRAATRRALAAALWAGGREFQRAFGSRLASLRFPASPDAARAWLAANPPAPAALSPRVELLVLADDLAGARAAVAELPTGTAWQRFVRADLESLVDYQTSGVADDGAVEAAAAQLVDPVERAEAKVGMAITTARRGLPTADWRVPLNQVRSGIPESDARILLRDHGWVVFVVLWRRLWPVPLGLLVLAIALDLAIA